MEAPLSTTILSSPDGPSRAAVVLKDGGSSTSPNAVPAAPVATTPFNLSILPSLLQAGQGQGSSSTPSTSSFVMNSSDHSNDTATPRSIRHYDLQHALQQDVASTSAGTSTANMSTRSSEPDSSPFFAGWDKSSSAYDPDVDINRRHDNNDPQEDDEEGIGASSPTRRYSLTTTSATSSITPLYATATSPLFVSSHSQSISQPQSTLVSPIASNSTSSTSVPFHNTLVNKGNNTLEHVWVHTPLFQSQDQSTIPTPPLSPLPSSATAPGAPMLSTAPTPVLTPRNSQPLPTMAYFRSLSPLQHPLQHQDQSEHYQDEPGTGAGSIHALLDMEGRLPFPGQQTDEDVTISSATFSFNPSRSDSADSISSVLNDCGGNDSFPDGRAMDTKLADSAAGLMISQPMYVATAAIQDINAPPLMQAFPSLDEGPVPIPPAKDHSDFQLIPSLRKPSMAYLAVDLRGNINEGLSRPISPFSPTQTLFPADARSPTTTLLDSRTNTPDPDPDPDRDLINFDSDGSEAAFAMRYECALVDDFQEGDAIYFAADDERTQGREYGDSDRASTSSNEDGEDYDSHMLYSTLSLSASPYVRKAWEGSKVFLVPPKYTLPAPYVSSQKEYNGATSLDRPHEWERYTAIHALRQQAGSPDLFVGYGSTSDGRRLHAKLDSANGQLEISLKEELKSPPPPSLAPRTSDDLSEFGMSAVGYRSSQPLTRHTVSASMVSSTSASSSAIPPHLLVSSSPASSAESSNFPTTPPLSPNLQGSLPVRSSSMAGTSDVPAPQGVAFPSVDEQAKQKSLGQMPLSPMRKVRVVREKHVYRKRRVLPETSNSAPTTLPHSSASSRQEASKASTEAATLPPQKDRLSKLSTVSMQSISSMASVQTGAGKIIKKRDSKVRLRVPKWLGGGGSNRGKENESPGAATMQVTESAPATPYATSSSTQQPIQEEGQLVIEKVRVIQVDSYVVEWPGEDNIPSPRADLRRSLPSASNRTSLQRASLMHRKSSHPLPSASAEMTLRGRASFHNALSSYPMPEESVDHSTTASVKTASRHNSNASRISRRSSAGLKFKHTNSSTASHLVSRDFSSDIAYLLEPPRALEHLSGLFEQALKLIIRCSREFADRFRYIRDMEEQAVQHLQHDIMDQAWQYFAQEESIGSWRPRLLDIFENIVMAFAHDYVYTKTIRHSLADKESEFANLINIYRIHTISLSDFGISTDAHHESSFNAVIDILAELAGSGSGRQELWEKMPPQSYKRLVQLISETTDSASTVIALLEARTPLDTINQLRRIIDELVKATSSSDCGHDSRPSLATDDLIPLLSWTIVKASAKALPSLLFYTKAFRLSESTMAESEWTLVQFEAAIAYLCQDPLSLRRASNLPSPIIESHSVSPVQPTFLRANSDDGSLLAARSRRSSIQSLPSETYRTSSRCPSHQAHASSHHKRTMSTLPSARLLSQYATGRPSSIVSAVTTEEDEDNAAMGPPALPKSSLAGRSHEGGNENAVKRAISPASSVASSGDARLTDCATGQMVHRPVPVRPPHRAFHMAHDENRGATNQSTRIPLGRSQTTPVTGPRPQSYASHRISTELYRSGSDASRKSANDWWGPLRYARGIPSASPPIGSEGTSSSRPDSPAGPPVRNLERHDSERSSFDLERSTSDIGWVEWGRRRLSSMTSSTSLVDAADGTRSVADQIAEKLAASTVRSTGPASAHRGRRNSESSANMLNNPQFEDANPVINAENTLASDVDIDAQVHTQGGQRTLTRSGNRPRSTLSLSSTSSLETEASLNRSIKASSSPLVQRSHFRNSLTGPPSSFSSHSSNLSRSRRFRRELISNNLGPSMALPQLHLDTASGASVLSPNSAQLGISNGHRSYSSARDPLPTSMSSAPGNLAFPTSYSLSHSTSRLGTTPFSPIQEVAPSLYSSTASPENFHDEGVLHASHETASVPVTPKEYIPSNWTASQTPESQLPHSATSNTITHIV